MEIYVGFGLSFILGIFLLDIKNRTLNNIGKYIILFLFFFVAGLSYKIHNDYEIYEKAYKNINLIKNYSFEIGFIQICKIFQKFLAFYQFKAVVYFINTILIYKGIRYFFSKKDTLNIIALLYLYGTFYFLYLPSFRQSISISIFIFSLKYIFQKKFLKYALCIVLATLFHRSAAILFLVYFFINWLKVNKKILIILMLLNIGLYYFDFFIPIILGRLINILRLQSKGYYFKISDGGSPREFIFYALFYIFIIMIYNKKNDFIVKCFLLFQIFYLIQKYIPIGFRFMIYFHIFWLFVLILLFQNLKNKNIKYIIKYFLILFIFFNFNLRFIKTKAANGAYIPFHNSLELLYKEIPYNETAEYVHVKNRHKI